MQGHDRRFRLGLYVLAAGGLFLALLGFILQNSFDRARATYYILFTQNVKGMVVGSKVNFQGVPIGVVADMRFQDGKTLVELRVDPTRACIQDLTLARMDRLLVTGQVTVELEGYGPDGRRLSPGAFIKPKEDPLQALTASLPDVVDRAALVLGRLDRVLAGVEAMVDAPNREQVAATLANLERASAHLADATLPAADAAITVASATLRQAGDGVRSVQDAAAVLNRLEADVRTLLQEGTGLLAGLRGPAQTTLGGLRLALEDVRGLVRQLKLAPDSLLFGVQQPAAPAGGSR